MEYESKKKLSTFLVSYLVLLIYKFYYFFVNFKARRDIRKLIASFENPVILAFFHRNLLSSVYTLRNLNYSIFISKSKDGDIFMPLLKSYKYTVVRGSKNKDGKKGMYEAIALLNHNKIKGIAIAVDGSTGPLYKVKAGAIKIALETNLPIIPISFKYSNPFTLNTWDKMLVPKLLSTVTLLKAEPVIIKSKEDFELKMQELEQKLLSILP